MSCRVIKLILQPLVENAIYHGIKEKRGQGQIQILGQIEDGKIHFQVIDDGIGMTPEKLEQINQLLKQDGLQQNEIGYGIFNVNTKIKLNFGDEYGLSFHSIYGQGAIVDLWHPMLDDNAALQWASKFDLNCDKPVGFDSSENQSKRRLIDFNDGTIFGDSLLFHDYILCIIAKGNFVCIWLGATNCEHIMWVVVIRI